MPRPPGSGPDGSPRFGRPSGSRPITVRTGLRPERAIELARSAEAAELTGDDADEMRIVAAGARVDLGHLDQALAVLSAPLPDPSRTGPTAARLFYAYAEVLLALGRRDEALQWFVHSAASDEEGVTDAEDRISELA